MISDYWKSIKNSDGFGEYYFLAIALILAFGTIQTTGAALETDKPVVTVVSCSMYPEYDVGDIIFVQGTDFDELEVGDIIVYDVPKKIDITVDGETYGITQDNPAYTEAGGIQLKQVDLQSKAAIITINGSTSKIIQGQSFEQNGHTIEVNSISGMNIPVIHRTIEKNENYLETQGDNTVGQHEFEKNITENQIHGKALASAPRIGLVKIITMDLIGFSGDKPLALDNTPKCFERN